MSPTVTTRSRRAPIPDPSGSMQHEPGTEHTHANEQDQQEAEVFGNVSIEAAFRNRILGNKRRLLYEMNAMPEVNDEDIAELEAIHTELMAKK